VRVSTIHVRALVGAVERLGFSRAQLFDEAQRNLSLLANDYAYLSVDDLDDLTCAAVRLTDDPAFGLHWGEHASLLQLDLVSLLVAAAPSLRVGITSVLRSQAILGDRPELSFREHNGQAELRFEPLAVSPECARVRTDLAVAGFAYLLQVTGASANQVPGISFAHARPSYGAEYERLFQGRAQFAQPYSGIGFSAELLEQRLGTPNAALYPSLDRQAQQLRERLLVNDSLRARVVQHTQTALPRAPSMREAANALGISERSLRRRLLEEGCTFTSLVESVRLERARALLKDEARSIKEIAAALGFSELSAFHRAFKRWTGDTPVTFRARTKEA
jgi:AraC-like DNA-binding protein